MSNTKTIEIETLPKILLIWTYLYTKNSNYKLKFDELNNTYYITEGDQSSACGFCDSDLFNITISLMVNERIGVTPITTTIGENKGKKDWYAAYEFDSTNPFITINEINDAYHDGDTPSEAILKCYLFKHLGKQVTFTINDKGDYIHVEHTN